MINAVSWPFYARERYQLPFERTWLVLWAGLDATENLASTGVRTLNRPSRNESLWQLSNPGHIVVHNYVNVIDTGRWHSLKVPLCNFALPARHNHLTKTADHYESG
jgi:hypothetical protein